MQLNKNIKIFLNFIIGPLLFLWLAYSVYQQILAQPKLDAAWDHLRSSWGPDKFLLLSLVVVLMMANWGIESQKWKMAVRDVHRFNFFQAFKAVLSGVSFSVVMPNRVGEYLGRMMHMPVGKRLRVVALAIICGFSQLLVTVFAGLGGLLSLKEHLIGAGFLNELGFQWCAGILVGVVAILTLLYFNVNMVEKLGGGRLRRRSWYYLVEVIREFSVQRLGYLLGLSIARYLVFVIQYILVFSLFDVNVSPLILLGVMSLVFLSLAVIPTIALAEIGLRGTLTLQLLGMFTTNSLGIVLATVVVWVINLIIPALVGTILMLQVRLFRSTSV